MYGPDLLLTRRLKWYKSVELYETVLAIHNDSFLPGELDERLTNLLLNYDSLLKKAFLAGYAGHSMIPASLATKEFYEIGKSVAEQRVACNKRHVTAKTGLKERIYEA